MILDSLKNIRDQISTNKLTIDHLNQNQRIELETILNDFRRIKDALSLHDMFKQAHGNPFSIALMSSIY